MDKVIKLIDIRQEYSSKILNVSYVLELQGGVELLDYKVVTYFCNDIVDEIAKNCDSVVTSMLYIMMSKGYDFESNYPISDKLYHNIVYHLIPQLAAANKEVHKVRIKAPLTSTRYEGKWVGTGISCGVDSFAAVKEYTEDCELPDYKLTHLLYFKVGAHHGMLAPCPVEIEEKIYNEELAVVHDFCEKYSFPLVTVESNINNLCDKIWGVTSFEAEAIPRNAGVMLMLQKYFCKYICASSLPDFKTFDLGLDSGFTHSLQWSLPLLSSQSIDMIPANKAMTRVDKTIYISDYKPSYDSLMVCWKNKDNCGVCPKCLRTQVTLDFVGVLDNYAKSFNIELYKKNKNKFINRVVARQYADPFYKEIMSYAKEHDIETPNFILSFIKDGFVSISEYQLWKRPDAIKDFFKKMLYH